MFWDVMHCVYIIIYVHKMSCALIKERPLHNSAARVIIIMVLKVAP